MLNLPDQPGEPCHIPRHLAQSLLATAMRSEEAEYGYVQSGENEQELSIHTVGSLSRLQQALQTTKYPVQAVYQTHFRGTPGETEAFCSLARTCNRSLLCLGIGTDTKGRIEIQAFLADHQKCWPISEELEEDGRWSAAI
ncbi:MAG: hypothetical protein D6703_05410 [Zetaproteobacteria bacterium]|nr:MAG: hypothetical protein D6703_05410 [Zetaproteobacteria bacterium]